MALNFPDTTGQPTDGSFTYTFNDRIYVWNGTYWTLSYTIPIGYTGSSGVTGYTGSSGVTGYTGSQGIIGFVGSQGVTGYTGSSGIIGYTGSSGIIGYTGSQGVTGYTGSGFNSNVAIFTGSIQEQVYTLTDASTIIIEPGNGTIQYLTSLGSGRIIDVSNFVNGEAVTLMINDNSGAGSVTTWTTVEWVNNGGIAPVWPDSGNYTVISLWKVNGTVYGALVGDGS